MTCPDCGIRPIKPNSQKHKLCIICFYKFNRMMAKMKRVIKKSKEKLPVILCSKCGNEFKPKERDVKFCSTVCKDSQGFNKMNSKWVSNKTIKPKPQKHQRLEFGSKTQNPTKSDD